MITIASFTFGFLVGGATFIIIFRRAWFGSSDWFAMKNIKADASHLVDWLFLNEPATAEVKEQEKTIGWAMEVNRLNRNATIERCAQVAESYTPGPTGGKQIAAEIRALKDQP